MHFSTQQRPTSSVTNDVRDSGKKNPIPFESLKWINRKTDGLLIYVCDALHAQRKNSGLFFWKLVLCVLGRKLAVTDTISSANDVIYKTDPTRAFGHASFFFKVVGQKSFMHSTKMVDISQIVNRGEKVEYSSSL